ncbi:phytanoyl-CoA dioxygenase family protein [bacterium]|nr:phytanoyl-CoA dioxygenase family protein [bacterium]
MKKEEEEERYDRELVCHGLCVVRGVSSKEVCERLREEALTGVQRKEAMSMTMAERMRGSTHRWFLPIVDSHDSSSVMTRTSFRMSMTPALRTVVDFASGLVGDDFELSEALFIISEKGASAQSFHSDGDYSEGALRTITLFVALQDILDESMGPTQFIPDTHRPQCFFSGKWLPPLPKNGLNEKQIKWFPLQAGDAVLMESTLWHRGGCNVSNKKRVLLSLTFKEKEDKDEKEEE